MKRSERNALERDETKKRLLIAARNLFLEFGWSGVTARSLAKVAGRSVSAIYTEFGSMERLFVEATGASVPNPIIFATQIRSKSFTDTEKEELANNFLYNWAGKRVNVEMAPGQEPNQR